MQNIHKCFATKSFTLGSKEFLRILLFEVSDPRTKCTKPENFRTVTSLRRNALSVCLTLTLLPKADLTGSEQPASLVGSVMEWEQKHLLQRVVPIKPGSFRAMLACEAGKVPVVTHDRHIELSRNEVSTFAEQFSDSKTLTFTRSWFCNFSSWVTSEWFWEHLDKLPFFEPFVEECAKSLEFEICSWLQLRLYFFNKANVAACLAFLEALLFLREILDFAATSCFLLNEALVLTFLVLLLKKKWN